MHRARTIDKTKLTIINRIENKQNELKMRRSRRNGSESKSREYFWIISEKMMQPFLNPTAYQFASLNPPTNPLDNCFDYESKQRRTKQHKLNLEFALRFFLFSYQSIGFGSEKCVARNVTAANNCRRHYQFKSITLRSFRTFSRNVFPSYFAVI